ncbi:MAG: nuclease-related domain-containing protein [Syntrophorhabdales bacterium]
MKEVFFSDYLEKKAKKSLAACAAWVGVSLTLLLIGIAAGVAAVLVSGGIAIMIALFVAVSRGPIYATYRCGIRGEQALRAHLLSSGLNDEYTAYYNLPLNGNGKASGIDCVLVGPSGLFVFEVKHHHGLILYQGGAWARIKFGRMGTLYQGRIGDPSGQLYRNY